MFSKGYLMWILLSVLYTSKTFKCIVDIEYILSSYIERKQDLKNRVSCSVATVSRSLVTVHVRDFSEFNKNKLGE